MSQKWPTLGLTYEVTIKTENGMIAMFPYLNNYEISAQDEANCAEACLVAAKVILPRNGMVTKEQFFK